MVTCVCFVIVLKMLYSVQHMSCLPWPCFSLAIWPAFAEQCSKVKRLPMHAQSRRPRSTCNSPKKNHLCPDSNPEVGFFFWTDGVFERRKMRRL
uniref:Secreted protein n=1 Tax=Oryza barthii TaxID=65489 RepID=A0A0D3FWW2_9ORYZ